MIEDVTQLPHPDRLFEMLRSGRHLCADDGTLYVALRAEYDGYSRLFGCLGFELVESSRGFYYFRTDGDLGKEAAQLAVFFFVLVEFWGDTGGDLEATAFDPVGLAVDELPHLTRETWRQCMAEADVHDFNDLAEVVRRLERYGFATEAGPGRFRFRTPAWRFLDLCAEVQQEAKQQVVAEDAENAP
ncbi:MAG: condensin complex protein MksE [Polyangiaceae bacterium]